MKIFRHPLTIVLGTTPLLITAHQAPTLSSTFSNSQPPMLTTHEVRTPCLATLTTSEFLTSIRNSSESNSSCRSCDVTCPDSSFPVTFRGNEKCSESCSLRIDPCTGGLLPEGTTLFALGLNPRPSEFSLPIEGLTSSTGSFNTFFPQ